LDLALFENFKRQTIDYEIRRFEDELIFEGVKYKFDLRGLVRTKLNKYLAVKDRVNWEVLASGEFISRSQYKSRENGESEENDEASKKNRSIDGINNERYLEVRYLFIPEPKFLNL